MRARARARVEPSSAKLERRVARVNVRASRSAMKLFQVGAPGYGDAPTRAGCMCAWTITRGARARPIAARGSPVGGQSASPGQPATAWSRACCSRALSLTRDVIVTSARVANTVDTSWRHGAPRERHTSSPPLAAYSNVVYVDFALSWVREARLFLSSHTVNGLASSPLWISSSFAANSIFLYLSPALSLRLCHCFLFYTANAIIRGPKIEIYIFFLALLYLTFVTKLYNFTDLFYKIFVLFLDRRGAISYQSFHFFFLLFYIF